jgi:cytochrome c oxidase cbb3-type subunit 3/ubiquinol-cytochrome c reductase cytochrome c subunit
MNPKSALLGSFSLILLAAFGLLACNAAPGRPGPDSIVSPPDQLADFATLYRQNCAGCHGAEGKHGPSIQLGDPLYLALVDDTTLQRTTSQGVPGTPMPAFLDAAGGMLTVRQIESIVRGIRAWATSEFTRADLPPHAAPLGSRERGADAYARFCSSCHGPDGKGTRRASSIVDTSYLALVSNQDLRTNVIVGRPDFGFPDFRGDQPGTPMSSRDVSDVVAWLAAQRPSVPGGHYAGQPPDHSMGELP